MNHYKTPFELAIEYYAPNIIKNFHGYSLYHINEICSKETPVFHDTYAIRARGYYTNEESLLHIKNSTTTMAKKIITLVEDNDFIKVDDNDLNHYYKTYNCILI